MRDVPPDARLRGLKHGVGCLPLGVSAQPNGGLIRKVAECTRITGGLQEGEVESRAASMTLTAGMEAQTGSSTNSTRA